MLVTVSAIDLTHRIIPNRIVLPAFVIVLVAQTLLEPSPEWALAALGASGFLFLAVLAYPAGMGMGDVKLALLMGAALGKTVAVALMFGMVAALVPAVILLAGTARRRGRWESFGPFLALAQSSPSSGATRCWTRTSLLTCRGPAGRSRLTRSLDFAPPYEAGRR